jgi:hypothetical protein
MIKKLGPEMMPSPQVGNKFMSGLMKLTKLDKLGIEKTSDEDITMLSKNGI